MKMKKIAQAAAMGLLLSVPTVVALAEDPIKVAPNMYSVLFENERVRVMQVTFKVGEKIAKHSHPDHFVYVLEGGKLKISKPDGTSMDADAKAGQVMWIPAETHWAENTGTSQVRLLVTELKKNPQAAAAKK